MNIELIHGDCVQKLKELPDNSVDSIVTDPPYGLSFMGKKWDYDVPSQEIWEECLRVLKPGGYLLSFAGTRTQHRMAVRIEDAGFEIRDMIFWNYASGFPKSTNIYKQFQKMCTCGNMEAYDNERTTQESKHNLRPMFERDLPQEVTTGTSSGEVLQSSMSEQSSHGTVQGKEPKEGNEDGKEPSMEGWSDVQATQGQLQGGEICSLSTGVSSNGTERRLHNGTSASRSSTTEHDTDTDTGSTSQRPQPIKQFTGEPCAFCKQHGAQEVRTRASEIYGFGSALKPACEPITVARKPLSEKNLAENVLTHGTGGLNIDGCRVETPDGKPAWHYPNGPAGRTGNGTWNKDNSGFNPITDEYTAPATGRFPANLVHDGSDEVLGLFPETTKAGNKNPTKLGKNHWFTGESVGNPKIPNDNGGSAARFFYCAKASKKDRDEGLEGFAARTKSTLGSFGNQSDFDCPDGANRVGNKGDSSARNFHPTVKPTDLMRYLCRLVTPPGGTVLDPFMGSGSTGKAAKIEGFNFIGIEREAEYIEIARSRIEQVENRLF